MHRTDARFEKSVQGSLLDRLLDDDPETRSEVPPGRAESLRRFRAAIKRDLEWLLNTIRAPLEIPASCPEAMKSVITYGLPDMSTLSLQNTADEIYLLQSIEETIELFEPRLKNVRVSNPFGVTPTSQTILFHVDALLIMDPAPERISFDTVLEVGKGAYSVKEG